MERNYERNGSERMSFEKHGRGMIAKNLIHNYLINEGYQVFSEDTSQGLIDMVAVREDGDVLFIDAKALSRRSDGTKINRILRKGQRELEKALQSMIQLIYADTETGEIIFNRR